MYIVFAITFGLVGGLISIIMRAELMEPGAQVLGGDNQLFNVLISAHGLIMVFFLIMPAFIGGFGNWFVPLMIGAPDMAFPRLNNISFWVLIPSALGWVLLIATVDVFDDRGFDTFGERLAVVGIVAGGLLLFSALLLLAIRNGKLTRAEQGDEVFS